MRSTSKKTIDSTVTPAFGTTSVCDSLAPSNDNAEPRDLDTTELVARPDVVRYTRATLGRYGVPSQDLADAIADVQTAAIEVARLGQMPASAAQWKGLCAGIAGRWAMKRQRDAEVQGKHDAGLCDDPDAYERPTLHWEQRDPVDTKRYLAVLKGLFDSGRMPPDGAEILWAEAEGVPHAEVAAELGVTENTVRKRLFRMRATFRAALGGLGMLVLAWLLLFLLRGAPDKVAAPGPRQVPDAAAPARCASDWDGGVCPAQKSSAVEGTESRRSVLRE